MQRSLTAILLISLSAVLHAQPDTAWVYNYGTPFSEDFGDMTQTADSGFAIIGTSNNECLGLNDMYFIKTGADRTVRWSRAYGGAGSEKGRSLVSTFDGGYALAGFTNSFGNGGYDGYIVRINSWGNIIWSRTLGGSNWDFIYSIAQTGDSGFVVCGETYSFGNGGKDAYAVRLDKNGNTVWTKTYGGAADDLGSKIMLFSDTAFAMIGETQSFGAGNRDFYLLLLDSYGNAFQTRTYGSTRADYGLGLDTTSDGGFILVGMTDSLNTGNEQSYIVKIDNLANETWSRINNVVTRDVVQTPDNGYAVSGRCSACGSGGKGLYMMRLDANGWWMAGPAFGGSGDEEGYSVIRTIDGGLLFAGTTTSYGQGNEDIYTVYVKRDTIVMNYTLSIANYSDTISCAVGLPSILPDEQAASLYPNPAQEHITISHPYINSSNKKITFFVTDMLGKEVMSVISDQNNFVLHRGDLSPGTYLYTFLDQDNHVLSRGKFVFLD
ncbi:MAG: T9SS type A sorting domain-containing protein [Bacteroidota bacterium]